MPDTGANQTKSEASASASASASEVAAAAAAAPGMGLPKCVSALVALLAIVPLLVAADGIYAAFFPSDVPLRLLPDAAFQFPDYALPTDSGYLPVDDTSPARMFYAYYEALRPLTPPADTPIILWLQGGPGCSSMTGNFYEFGPWRTAPDMQLHRNDATWNARFGLLFLDNPVGSGYSIADDEQQIPTDQQQVAEHLWAALNHFFHQHPAYRPRPFFLAGESYAGKYVPALGYHIMRQHDLHSHRNFRLDGLLIGNGLTHPVVQVQTHAQTAYAFALIDHQQTAHVEELASEVVRLVEAEEWLPAAVARTALVDYIQNESGLATLLDVRRSVPYHCAPDATDFLAPFLNQPAVKAALKAQPSAVWVSCNPRVRRVLLPDVMKSVKWQVEQLLPRYPILLYQGQYDAKDGVACSEEWMRTLTWNHLLHFFAADRNIWKVEGDLAGYWRTFDTLTHVVVAGAGHQVPADQGLFAQRMVETWLGHVLSSAF